MFHEILIQTYIWIGFFVLIVLLVIKWQANKKTPEDSSVSPPEKVNTIPSQADKAELAVDAALRGLQENRYFVFRDLIIPSSSKKVELTQIDHVLVCRLGIFCIETKSNHGYIYGFTQRQDWKQYLGYNAKPYTFHSPYRQNKHHVSSLELLLVDNLKAPIHSYLAFPNAKKVVINGRIEDMSPEGVVSKINKHMNSIYEPADIERIAKILAHAGTFREQLRNKHVDDVKAFIDAKVAETLKLS
ncbi:hypothetical protein BGO18_01900 [Candidatus Saccharibacteria bacterium 47-87]|nr:NERD domain-containing protein [Candidatus Saccharibacteria bacterium]OJU96915.1 MAG: hypothetical protein BGO18_01900 [Candidatus Saccharibacteria bacterium 47-87]